MAAEDWDAFRRVHFRRADKLTWDELAGQLQTQEQVLCVAYEQDFYHFFPSLFLGNMNLIFNISAFSELFKKLLLLPSP